jgi:hypothetical protein
MYYNLDWASPGMNWDNAFAVVLVLAGALCFGVLHIDMDRACKCLAVLLGLGLLCNNAWNALENISTIEDRRIDGRSAEIARFSDRSSDRRQWSTTVDDAKVQLQGKSTGLLEADLQQYLATNAAKWRATNHCDVAQITKSQAFCTEVKRLEGLVETGKARDKAQAKIEALDEKQEASAAPPTNADPMAVRVQSMLAAVGVTPTTEGLVGIRHWRSLQKTFMLEAVASLMPMIWIAIIKWLIALLTSIERGAAAMATRLRNAQAKLEQKAEEPEKPAEPVSTQPKGPKSKITPEFERFVADVLETGDATWALRPTPAYDAWKAWCGVRGLMPGSQRVFGEMMKERFGRDPNNGYPRYLGVRLRPKASPQLVVSNAA